MKKLTALMMLAAFSTTAVLQAGEGATTDKNKSSCCDNAKTSAQAKSSCSDASSCCAARKTVASAKPEEKGAALLVKLTSDSRAKS